ncbi:MAG: type II toxin-antitoxin system RelE/ParE family toxin [Pseudomonadota bacterium]|nr:type II toxin-antitoxin system RelE/ParE family toxin [Pseudomonadota bacterium]
MTWTVEISETAARQLAKLDRPMQERIRRFLRGRLASEADPRRIGKALQGRHALLWRYRVGDYRLICQLRDPQRVVLLVAVGHRREIYR